MAGMSERIKLYKHRLKRCGKWLAILFGVLIVINGVLSWNAERRLENKLAALRDAGEPTTLAELAPEPAPPGQDAGVLLRRVATDAESLQKELNTIFEEQNEGDWELDSSSPELIAAVEKAIANYEHIFPVIEEASKCPSYVPAHDYTLDVDTFMKAYFDSIGQNRIFVRCLNARAAVRLARGQADEALMDGIAILRLTHHFDQEPMLVGYLVSLSCRGHAINVINRTLREGKVSPAVRIALVDELATHDDMAGYVHTLRTERIWGSRRFREMYGGWKGAVFVWFMKNWHSEYLDAFDKLVRQGSKPQYQVTEDLSFPNSNVLMQLLMPSIQATRGSMDRTRAQLRCLRVLNALQVYREKQGKEAKSLDDLDLPNVAKVDPFTGQPLLMKNTDRGWIIYCVGSDGKDDGGPLVEELDYGIAPVELPKPKDD